MAILTNFGLLVALLFAYADAGTSAFQFTEEATLAGIHAQMRCGSPEKRWITEANGSGAAWLDYDNDGLMDLLIVNGSDMDRLRQTLAGNGAGTVANPQAGGVFLYRNLGGGHFEDVTMRTGLANAQWGTGANAADYNNDGFTDILITSIGIDLLYKNNGNGTFTEVGKAAGLSQDVRWHTGSGFGDFDGDGFLDLYVTGYVDIHAYSLNEPAPACKFLESSVFCGPIGLPGQRGILYHNNGNGTFTDITQRAGLNAAKPSHGFSVVCDDFNHDGKLDIFVANDSDPNFLFLNQGDGTFKEAALERGVAFNADGHVQANMGVAIGNVGAGGELGLITTTFADDYFPLFRQDKTGFFDEVAATAGLAKLTKPYFGWATGFADFDNDGQPDLWTANGHVYPKVAGYNEPVALFRGEAGRFAAAFSFPPIPDNSYRGGAAGDFDNDGQVDLVVLPIAGQPLLLHNRTANSNAWVGLQLKGTRSNRDAIGATVQIEACGKSQFASIRNGGSYLSRDDPRLHFGLGGCSKIDRLTIRWPRGASQVLTDLPVRRYLAISEPQ